MSSKLRTKCCVWISICFRDDLAFGEVSAEAGHAAYEYLKTAIELANEGKIDAICTAPLNKEALA